MKERRKIKQWHREQSCYAKEGKTGGRRELKTKK